MASVVTPPSAFRASNGVVANASVTGTLAETELATATLTGAQYETGSFIQIPFSARMTAAMIASCALRIRLGTIAGTILGAFNVTATQTQGRGWIWTYIRTATSLRVFNGPNLLGGTANAVLADVVITAGQPLAFVFSATLGNVADQVNTDYVQALAWKVS